MRDIESRSTPSVIAASTPHGLNVTEIVPFELLRFVYTGEVDVDPSSTSNELLMGLMMHADRLSMHVLFERCIEILGGRHIANETFFALESIFSVGQIRDDANRALLLVLLVSIFKEHHDCVSSDSAFPMLSLSVLLELLKGGRMQLPSFIVARWNQFFDKSMDALAKVKQYLGSQGAASLRLTKRGTGEIVQESSCITLQSDDVEALVDVSGPSRITVLISGLVHNRIGLLNDIFEVRQTRWSGIYEFLLKDGSLDMEPCHVSGSADEITFCVTIGVPTTVISMGDTVLVSSANFFSSFDAKIASLHKNESTKIHIIDILPFSL